VGLDVGGGGIKANVGITNNYTLCWVIILYDNYRVPLPVGSFIPNDIAHTVNRPKA